MDDKNRHLSESEILEITKKAMHKTFGDFGLDQTYNPNNKGGLGGFVEENVFKYRANNDDNPDFIDAGIELKVTPLKQNKNGTISSKERLVLNTINYKEEGSKDFKTSSFYRKNKRLLIWFYLYSKGIHPSNFEITDYNLFEFEHSLEAKVIERDWNIIHNKIVKGKAHEISESDTEFLAACTKGADSKELTDQFIASAPKAKRRAYSFKGSYMTYVYRNYVHSIAPYTPSISEDEWMKNPLEEIYKERMSVFHGLTQQQLCRKVHVNYNPKYKSLNFAIAKGMLGIRRGNQTPEMEIAGITLRTITIDKNGYPTEGMPFNNFEFEELINTPWDESYIREDFVDLKMMIFVFREIDGVISFDRVHFWNCPNSIVDGPVQQMHEQCASMVREGTAFYFNKKDEVIDKFPKEKRGNNGVCHVRPHARRGADKYHLPTPDRETGITEYTKQSFWFNKEFVQKILEEKI